MHHCLHFCFRLQPFAFCFRRGENASACIQNKRVGKDVHAAQVYIQVALLFGSQPADKT